jgi:hypothetical protein
MRGRAAAHASLLFWAAIIGGVAGDRRAPRGGSPEMRVGLERRQAETESTRAINCGVTDMGPYSYTSR